MEAFWCLVPVSSDALRSQLDLLVSLVYYLAKTKVSNLYLSVMEDNILWLKVVVNNFLFAFVQILKSTQDLRYYELNLLLSNLAVLFKVEIQIWSRAKLQNSTKTIVVYFNGIELFDYPSMVQVFMYLVLSYGMLYVVVFDLL